MSTTRLRRWIAEHPVLTALGQWLAAAVLLAIAMGTLLDFGREISGSTWQWLAVFAVLAVLMALLGLGSFLQGRLLGRSGGRVTAVGQALVWLPLLAPLVTFVGFSVLVVVVQGLSDLADVDLKYMAAVSLAISGAVMLWLGLPLLAGLGLAMLITRRRLRRGQWQTIVATSPVPRRDFGRWAGGRPATAMLLATGLLTVAWLELVLSTIALLKMVEAAGTVYASQPDPFLPVLHALQVGLLLGLGLACGLVAWAIGRAAVHQGRGSGRVLWGLLIVPGLAVGASLFIIYGSYETQKLIGLWSDGALILGPGGAMAVGILVGWLAARTAARPPNNDPVGEGRP